MEDDETLPSLHHLWQDIELRHSDGLLTDVD